MANFTETQIQDTMHMLKWTCGIDNIPRELAILMLEDWQRKGCSLEYIGDCYGGCSVCKGDYCPLDDWKKRHPEYVNDELAMKIKALESKAKDQFKTDMKTKVIGEFKKLKMDIDLTEAAGALEIAARDRIEALKEFEGAAGLADEIQLKALAKVNKAFVKIHHSKLGFFLEKTKWFEQNGN